MATIPAVPTENAGQIAASADWQDWSNAANWLYNPASGNRPVFFLQALGGGQTLTTSFTALNWSNTAPIFKDNDGGWSSGNASRYTFQTAGYWSIDWVASAQTGGGLIEAYVKLVTSSSNIYNPSATINFQHNSRPAFTTGLCAASSCGLIPAYVMPNDYIQVVALVGTSVVTGTTPTCQLTGEWISS